MNKLTPTRLEKLIEELEEKLKDSVYSSQVTISPPGLSRLLKIAKGAMGLREALEETTKIDTIPKDTDADWGDKDIMEFYVRILRDEVIPSCEQALQKINNLPPSSHVS